jgi:hypothetical protein
VLRLLDPGPDCLGPLAAPALEARYGITLTQLEVVARFLFITHAKGAEPDGLVAALRVGIRSDQSKRGRGRGCVLLCCGLTWV